MELDYEDIQKQCIDWFKRRVGNNTRPFPKNSTLSVEYYNELANIVKNYSEFEEFDVALINKKRNDFNKKLFLITTPSFEPRNKGVDSSSLNSGKWRYLGHVMEIENNKVKYVTSPGFISESNLEKLI